MSTSYSTNSYSPISYGSSFDGVYVGSHALNYSGSQGMSRHVRGAAGYKGDASDVISRAGTANTFISSAVPGVYPQVVTPGIAWRPDTKAYTHEARTRALRYLLATLATFFFSMVYEHFSHNVWSWWMAGACAFPALLGLVPALIAWACGWRAEPFAMNAERQGWACGVVALTLGSLFFGVLEIYGTTSDLGVIFWVAGVVTLVLTAAFHIVRRRL